MPYGHKECEEDIAAILNDGPNLINDIRRNAAEHRDAGDAPRALKWLAMADLIESKLARYRDRFAPAVTKN